MCNHASKLNQTTTLLHAGHILAPMEVDDRPCEAVLAGSPVIATRNMLCHGGPGGGWPCRLNSAAPRPLCYFLRGESRTIIKQSLARVKHPCKALILKAGVSPCGTAKGLSGRPLETFGPCGAGFLISLETFGPKLGKTLQPSIQKGRSRPREQPMFWSAEGLHSHSTRPLLSKYACWASM